MMNNPHFWIFVGSLAILAYTFAGYHMLTWLQARFHPAPSPAEPEERPGVTVVIAMHNEAGRAVARVQNLLEQDYPESQLRVIAVLDGCTDDTAAQLRGMKAERLSVIENGAQQGKAACLNLGLARTETELVVFTDSRQRFEPDAIRHLTRHFVDDRVGAVSGRLVIEAAAGAAGGVGAYWRLETSLRQAEGRLGAGVGCTGAIYAIRRKLWTDLPADTILDDVLAPMWIAKKGYQVRFEPAAIARDPQATDTRYERRRKLRTLAGNYQVLFRHPAWTLPFGHPLWWRLISHKLLRLVAPYFLLAAIASNLFLLELCISFQITLAAQILCYAAAVLGLLLPKGRIPLVNAAAGFLFLNIMSALSFWAYLVGPYRRGWRKQEAQDA